MKALVILAPAQEDLEERPKPQLKEPDDAIVKIIKTTIAVPICISSRASAQLCARAASWAMRGLA